MGSDNALSTLSKLNSQLDEIQSAYSTLSSAVSEYNSNGNISIDTMQSVIALGDNWLDYIDMESGAFTLDQEALNKLTQARIEDMKQQALANLASTVESITTEADATKYLASTNYDAANSYQELAKAKLSEVQSNLQKKVEEGSLSQDSYDKIISKFESDANKISQIFDNTSFKLTADGSIGDSLSELESHANLLKSIQDELQNTSRLSSSTLDSIAKAFPELNESVKQFRNGLLSSEELFALLEQAYNDDADAYISNQIKKSQYDGTYYDNLVSANNEFFQGLFDAYGEDLEKSKNLAHAKKVINDKVISLLASSWGKFYQTEIDNATGLMKIASKAKVTNSYLIVIAANTKRCTQILLPGNDTAIYIRSTYTDNTLWTNWKSNNTDIEIKNCFCKNIASINGTLEGYGYNYCYYNNSTKIGILHFASRIETPDSTLNNFSGYYDVTTVLKNMGITSFNKILESNYTPYDSTGVVRAKLIGYGTTLLYSSASQHYAFARYYTKDGEKGAWATSEFQKGDYITGSLIFS